MVNQKLIEEHNDPFSADLGVLNLASLPFEVQRIYWITNFKKDTVRGQHAHKKLIQLIMMLQGSMELIIFEGERGKTIQMTPKKNPVIIEPGKWRVMKNASEDAVVLVLASLEYDEGDYIRNWNEYLEWYRER